MSLSNLPLPVRRALHAVQSGDGAALRAALGGSAVVTEEEREYRGADIDLWFAQAARRCSGPARPIDGIKSEAGVILTMLTDERDAAGQDSEVLRDWHLTIEGEQVAAIRIVGRAMPALPPPIAAYVRATNRSDLDALLALFADDALVNDQLCDYWGREAIRGWAARDVIGARLTMHVVGAVEQHGHVVVTAHVNGDFDRRGLPDPLILAFYFSAWDGRIVQLIILRNHAGT